MSDNDWGDWEDRDDKPLSPYVHWAREIGGELSTTRDENIRFLPDNPDELVPVNPEGVIARPTRLGRATKVLFDFAELDNGSHPRKAELKKIRDQLIAYMDEVDDAAPEIPRFALNENFDPETWLPNIPGNLDLPNDSIVVGVIDRGIALGHRSVRFCSGNSRILSAWQQISDRGDDASPQPGSRKLPFGNEFLSPDIDRRLTENSSNGQIDGDLDEDAFNRSVGHEDYQNIHGHRELGRRIAHGTHILNTAAGIVNPEEEPDRAAQLRIMTVNLPERSIVGLSSRNLEFFVLYGMLRIVSLADKIWKKRHKKKHKPEHLAGFPILINLSFAKQAGAKDGDDIISRFIKLLNRVRAGVDWHPVYLVTPAGNDNLDRCSARSVLGSCQQLEVPWRIQSEDQSSNYVEIWAKAKLIGNKVKNKHLKIQVTTSDGRKSRLKLGQPGQVMGIRDVVNVYCEKKIRIGRKGGRSAMVQYVVCTAPTLLHEPDPPAAPAGEWKILLQNVGNKDLDVYLDVQTDQSDQPDSHTSMSSYFDSEHYQRHHHETGRLLDTYNYPKKRKRRGGGCRSPSNKDRIDYDNFVDGDRSRPNPGPVRRHGTMNALGRFRTERPGPDGNYKPGPVVVGGYRLSDGKPANYSSSGVGRWAGQPKPATAAPTASFPTDDGYALTGRLGAGARDGSIVAMQGTSFAASQMTAYAARLLLENRWCREFRLKEALFGLAKQEEYDDCNYIGYADIEKAGAGRLQPDKCSIARVSRR